MIEWDYYRATTLDERVRVFRASATDSAAAGLSFERGRKRLAKWKAQSPFDSDGIFQQRLRQQGLTEQKLLELLSDREGINAPRLQEPPSWAHESVLALSDSSEEQLNFNIEDTANRFEILFLDLVQPQIARAQRKLREGVNDLVTSQWLQMTAEEVERLCLRTLPGRLLPLLVRTMALEMNVARVQGLLHGATTEERFASFIHRIRKPQFRLELFREYPVLARLVVSSLENWVTCTLEFFQRWCADVPAIRDAFSPAEDPGPLISIEADVGDPHHGNRSVWILECRSGLKVVYKPKSMAVDQHFQELLNWLNERGRAAPYRPLRVLDRGQYGWEEFIEPQVCTSREEVARFYQRSGGYVALLYALAATDFHHANLMAMGEHPVLVDLEALFHPSGLEPETELAGDIAERSFGESVLGSGLLPVPVWGGHKNGAFDLSGLGAEAGSQAGTLAPAWKGRGTDEMSFSRVAQVIESAVHRPKLNGNMPSPLDYLSEVESGFQQVYQLLEKHRDELLAKGGLIDRFAEDEVRVVLRDTSRYAEILQEGSHPDALRDALDRDRLFDRLWEDVTDRPRLARLIPVEIDDLWRGDIPLFSTKPGSRDLWASPDRHFPDMLDESGLDRVRRRLGQLGGEDLKRQLWFLRASLTTLTSVGRPAPRSRRARTKPGVVISRKELVEASRVIGDRLVESALHGAEDVTWAGLNLTRQNQWLLAPLGLDLYDGVPGIALFLAYLGDMSGQHRYTALARKALQTIRRKIDPDKRRKGFGQIGGFVGWGGVLYMLAHMGMLWGEPALFAEAHALVEELPDRIGKDRDLDVISGAAGCIAGLLCLHSCHPTARVLEVATQCGEHLLGHSRPMPQGLGWVPSYADYAPLAGFSHGAAGISWALSELAAQTGDERFRTAALGGIAYERSLFSPDAGNWPDLREAHTDSKQGSKETSQFVVAWCHGAPGIGLARLRCRELLHTPHFDDEIDTALRTTMTNGFGHNQSLCHGELGNLDLLLEAARVWPGSTWGKEAERIIASIMSSNKLDGWLCGNPLAVESPGLMTGLAGIGYGLLRCADPARVPSVLLLAPPIARLN